jgi:hypothetical protein
MDVNLLFLVLIVVVALIAFGAVRFDLLVARWRELVSRPDALPEAPPAAPPMPHGSGLRPHEAPAQRPGFHRSGRRH